MTQYIDTNLVQFYDSNQLPAGVVNQIDITSDSIIKITLTLEKPDIQQHGPAFLLVVDKYYRYLHHVAIKTCLDSEIKQNETVTLPLCKVLHIPPDCPIHIFLFFSAVQRAFPLRCNRELYKSLEDIMRTNQTQSVPEIPSFRSQLQALILTATNHKYVSRSNVGATLTGNNYQTLELGDTLRLGGRGRRLQPLKQIRFSGTKVLDLGANTGEISRYVRRLGARLVDGYEYDTFFVETGRMINAYTGMTRVSLFQGDIANTAMYAERYDIVIAFSVYVYIKNLLSTLAEISDALLLETHTLDHGLDFYLDGIRQHYPYFRHLGFTDEDNRLVKSRALLLFSTRRELLDELVNTDRILIPEGTINYYYNDKHRTFWDLNVFTEETLSILSSSGLDALLDYFENRYTAVGLDTLIDRDFRFFSPLYWPFYLLGYKDYLADRFQVTDQNRFLKYYSLAIEKTQLDPILKYLLEDRNTLHKKVELKYQDLDRARTHGPYSLPPLLLTSNGVHEETFRFRTARGNEITAGNLDGHHRLFIAKLLGTREIPFYTRQEISDDSYGRIIAPRYTLSEN